MKARIGFVPPGREPERVAVGARLLGEVGAGSPLEQPGDEE